jgi:hypothetical protein
MLQQATGDLPLGDYDRRVLTWVSSWSTGTVAALASLLTRSGSTPPGRVVAGQVCTAAPPPAPPPPSTRPRRCRRPTKESARDHVPAVLLLGFIVVVCLKTKSAQIGSVVLGVLFGLSLATTALGPPILTALTNMSTAVVQGLSSVGGA